MLGISQGESRVNWIRHGTRDESWQCQTASNQSPTLKDEIMKLSIITSVAALVFGLAGSAQAVQPFVTAYGGWGASSSVYVPSTSAYGVSPSYNSYGYSTYPSYSTYPGYATYPSYSPYPQYSSTWNAPNYQTPTYTYDPIHGDYHVNNGSSQNTWNSGYSNSSNCHHGRGQQNGYRW
jgi:hypothetical protein